MRLMVPSMSKLSQAIVPDAVRKRAGEWRRGWILRRASTEGRPFELTYRRVFILPTTAGWALLPVLLAMLLGSINYQLNLGYLLTFMVGATAAAGIGQTFRNLAWTRLQVQPIAHGFAGERVTLRVQIDNPGARERWALRLYTLNASPIALDLPAGSSQTADLLFSLAPHRGWQKLPMLRLETTFPLGLWKAWAWCQPTQNVLAWPQPEANAPEWPIADGVQNTGPESATKTLGSEEFSGLRPWRDGDGLRQVAWRAAARRADDQLPVKQFERPKPGSELYLDWHQCGAGLDTEQRLARLCAWVLRADQQARVFTLVLPGEPPITGTGAEHRERCLCALALFGGPR